MSKSYDDPEQYNGWTNRETWAVALHINNDQGWQESVFTSLREVLEATDEPYGDSDTANFRSPAAWAGEIIRENVEGIYDDEYIGYGSRADQRQRLSVMQDIGSLWRVNWTELGSSFLSDMEEVDPDS
jgi:hypothetical protein